MADGRFVCSEFAGVHVSKAGDVDDAEDADAVKSLDVASATHQSWQQLFGRFATFQLHCCLGPLAAQWQDV